jgi:hypothetical protein
LRGGAVWQLVGLITRRSQVQILPPLPSFSRERPLNRGAFAFKEAENRVDERPIGGRE